MSTQDIATQRAGLSEDKRALLARRLKGDAAAARPRDVIPRTELAGPEYPASFAQERMWFLTQFTPGNPVYNVPVSVLVRADIDVPLLERAYSEVVRRHEALRTSFRMGEDGHLLQVVHEPFAMKIEVIEARHRVGEDFTASVNALVSEEGARPFDLSVLPLFRVTLLRVSDEDYAMVTTVQHIAIDGWAYPLILREALDYYGAFGAGAELHLPEPTLRYVDYAVWQRQYLTGETLDRQVRYWRETLDGAPSLDLPTDRPRPAVASFRGRFHRFRVDTRITGQIRELCREEAATLNMVIMAAFYVLLHRYSGQDDVVVGTLLGNRPRAELEHVVGVFVNTAALRVDLAGDPSFREILRRTRRAVLDADLHQDLPFERLVDLLGVQRDTSRHPLFQALYFHHNIVREHRTPTAIEGLEPAAPRPTIHTRPVDAEQDVSLVDTGAAKFDLMLSTMESFAGFSGKFEYATDLFDAPTIARMAEHFRVLLDHASAAPDTVISEIPMLPAEEAALVAGGSWTGAGDLDHPTEPVVRAIEATVQRIPDTIAATDGTRHVTYREVDRWASRVAAALRAEGIGRGSVVAVLMDRSAATLAGLLGIWKAGAAYVPLDPAHPAERIAFMVRDSGAALVLTEPSLADSVPEGVRSIHCPAAPAAGESVAAVAEPVWSDDLAYLMYTSGSTGTPKAVAVEHGTVAAMFDAIRRAPGLAAGDVMLAVTTITFDISVCELFLPLVVGGRTVIATRDQATDGLALARLLDSEGITLLQVTPATWRMLVQTGWKGRPSMRGMVGGEALTADLADAMIARTGEIWNCYGPTEDTVWSTRYRLREVGSGSIPIGKPIEATRTYILDEHFQATPVGVPGELYLGGAGVARGYHGRPSLTAERFVPDPFSATPGARMYRTGDRTRWRNDGEILFMGRLDGQVKLRGFRIELGEIESTLRRHPRVAQAAAAVRMDTGDARLAAYVVAPEGEELPSADELKSHLRTHLPEYMIPAAIVPLDALPMTGSGKVDRRALPVPPGDEVSTEPVEPRTLVEEMVAEVWREVLRRDGFGVTDNFFSLGGHSLLATQVLARLTQTFEVEIPIRTFFQHPTIAGIATVIEEAGSPVLARMVDELEGLSPEEIEALLAEAGE